MPFLILLDPHLIIYSQNRKGRNFDSKGYTIFILTMSQKIILQACKYLIRKKIISFFMQKTCYNLIFNVTCGILQKVTVLNLHSLIIILLKVFTTFEFEHKIKWISSIYFMLQFLPIRI